ncbi:MAG TPA: hypothetical protein VFZ59_19705 [Verrucomicrobiae bacterium]|nr:hypothetical protein [Verrucomicrobiae bacterium]
MCATEIMRQIEALSIKEREELFVLPCDVVFRENRELLNALAT